MVVQPHTSGMKSAETVGGPYLARVLRGALRPACQRAPGAHKGKRVKDPPRADGPGAHLQSWPCERGKASKHPLGPSAS